MAPERTRCLDTQFIQQGKGLSVIHSALILFTNQKSLNLQTKVLSRAEAWGPNQPLTVLMPISQPNTASIPWANTGRCHLCCHGDLG